MYGLPFMPPTQDRNGVCKCHEMLWDETPPNMIKRSLELVLRQPWLPPILQLPTNLMGLKPRKFAGQSSKNRTQLSLNHWFSALALWHGVLSCKAWHISKDPARWLQRNTLIWVHCCVLGQQYKASHTIIKGAASHHEQIGEHVGQWNVKVFKHSDAEVSLQAALTGSCHWQFCQVLPYYSTHWLRVQFFSFSKNKPLLLLSHRKYRLGLCCIAGGEEVMVAA